MLTGMTALQKELQKEFEKFVDKEIIPYADQFDEQGEIPRDMIGRFAQQGYLGAMIPEKYQGAGMDPVTFGLLCEEIGRGSISLLSLLTVHGMVAQAIEKWGSEIQKQTWLPKLAKGEVIGAFGLSEPDVGSDPKSVESIATVEDVFFRLNGHKKWISYGQMADIFLIIAQCGARPAAFLVTRDTPGFEVEPIQGMLGFRSAMLAQLHLTNCLIAQENLIGKIGFGFTHVAGTALDYGRYCIAWGCVGLGKACLEACLRYTGKRKQFGALLRKHQLIQHMIADMITEVKAARMLCLDAAYLKSAGDPETIMETSIAKYYASTMAFRAANHAVQIHGANGCCHEYPVQRFFRDAKITEIIEGSSQIQQIIIARHGYQNYLFGEKNK
ncbi:MAG: anaB 1 [Firmicutes bacterium]|nr:anaB 1 [Bacillota bacterium]